MARKSSVALVDRHRKAKREWSRRNKQYLLSVRGGRCVDCGDDRHSAALHFDHRDPTEKSFEVGTKAASRRPAALLIEAEKCDIRCANCHAERTWADAGWLLPRYIPDEELE